MEALRLNSPAVLRRGKLSPCSAAQSMAELKNYPGRGKFSGKRFKVREEKINAAKEAAHEQKLAGRKNRRDGDNDGGEKKWKKPKCSRWLFPGGHYPGRPAPPKKGRKLTPEEMEAAEKDMLERLRRGEGVGDEKGSNDGTKRAGNADAAGRVSRGRYFSSSGDTLPVAVDKQGDGSNTGRKKDQKGVSSVAASSDFIKLVMEGEEEDKGLGFSRGVGMEDVAPLKVFFHDGSEVDMLEAAGKPGSSTADVKEDLAAAVVQKKVKKAEKKDKRVRAAESGTVERDTVRSVAAAEKANGRPLSVAREIESAVERIKSAAAAAARAGGTGAAQMRSRAVHGGVCEAGRWTGCTLLQ